MLTINGLRNFYYVPGVTDMRCDVYYDQSSEEYGSPGR